MKYRFRPNDRLRRPNHRRPTTRSGERSSIGAAAAAVGLPPTGSGAGIVLTSVRSIGEFDATMMVAYNPRTMPTRIDALRISRGLDAIVPVALALLAIALAVVALVQRVFETPGA